MGEPAKASPSPSLPATDGSVRGWASFGVHAGSRNELHRGGQLRAVPHWNRAATDLKAVWIHRDDSHVAPYASDLIEGASELEIVPGLVATPVPAHTRGSVVYLLDNRVLLTSDSPAWSVRKRDLAAFRDACWYSWDALAASLARLANYRFEWALPGHGWPAHCEVGEMQDRLRALVARMQKNQLPRPAKPHSVQRRAKLCTATGKSFVA